MISFPIVPPQSFFNNLYLGIYINSKVQIALFNTLTQPNLDKLANSRTQQRRALANSTFAQLKSDLEKANTNSKDDFVCDTFNTFYRTVMLSVHPDTVHYKGLKDITHLAAINLNNIRENLGCRKYH